jgi:hypothetical protein
MGQQLDNQETRMKKTTKFATFIASATMALLTTSVEAQVMPSSVMQAPGMISWLSDLWSMLGDNWRCSRCHEDPDRRRDN